MRVLGIYDGTHDAGAALVVDGVLVAAASEERFTRVKGAGGWPEASIAACLAAHRDGAIDRVAFPGLVNPNPAFRGLRMAQRRVKLDDGWFYTEARTPMARLTDWLQFGSAYPRMRSDGWAARVMAPGVRAILRRRTPRVPLALHDHHHCHAASTWFTSGFSDGLVIVADGVGDGLALTVWRGGGGRLERIGAMPYPDSYGLLYATITGFCGFRPFRHEGKLTGLAALGNADVVDVPFPFTGPPEARRFTQAFGAPLRPWLDSLRAYSREDVCAWLQRGVETEIRNLVCYWTARTGTRNVALAGGVFANVRLNQHVAALVDRLWVTPHMGDGGLAAGAAFLSSPNAVPVTMQHAMLGPSFSAAEMEGELTRANVRYRRSQDIEGEVAERLSKGQIVARFDGAMEYGPRALGNRSILAAAGEKRMTDRLNLALSRSDFMPFAPMLLADDAGEWVDDLAPVAHAARFMTVTVQAKPALAALCPAAIHVDGSLRPQLVDEATAPGLHRTLREYRRITGIPALINTSFNLHEEPIVRSPSEAIATWRTARIDALAMGPFLVAA